MLRVWRLLEVLNNNQQNMTQLNDLEALIKDSWGQVCFTNISFLDFIIFKRRFMKQNYGSP